MIPVRLKRGETGNYPDEWSDSRPDIDLTVDEKPYRYVVQDSNGWTVQ